MNQLSVNPYEPIYDFSNRLLHLCYAFPKQYMDRDFFRKMFKHLVWIYLNKCEYKPPYVPLSPTFINCETPIISEEEPIVPFVPCAPPFLVEIWMPPCDNVEVGKSRNKISDSPS